MPKTTNPRQAEHHFYRLEPVAAMLDRDEWEASTVKETCFVWAANAQEARAMVEVETRTRQSESETKLPFFSPWSSSSFTSCTRESGESESPYPAGAVFTRSGLVTDAGSSREPPPRRE